ncbi:1-deoxy-D-xylulose-5-phosphate reductoisomerase [Jeotgalibacillus proteolyticus]|uniref:1-deoxy-D-xylulose 5-phosphate reductoisomerase n=1 Tax=Jeotgalibacillus proteolyticus TaxID=2082395 RepID=A0A2S5GGI9_9BACL|nr:1-deoxy-D-xylulose-5-phosphate reductoisomerase [Jeotgalibacillus proteolyticus]PPA72031.1 1-deoxy-D-xylulose-5-phosphate reductoisomerase [Jeotgalibacillus proteolyticus]
MKKISLMGASGSIGLQTLDILREHKESFELTAFSVGKNLNLARKAIIEFQPKLVSVQLKEDAETLKSEGFSHTKIVYGQAGLVEVAVCPDSDTVVNAVLGSVGLEPTMRAIEAKKNIAIANKETLVTAGHLVMEAAKKHNVSMLPVDSEHSAIFQALQGENKKNIERLIITASGGSFRDRTRDQLSDVTLKDALHHPNWSMGAKITIDSASMMNKGLEVIEAHWLFDLPYEKIDVLLHKESIIHSMVEFHDSSVIAQLGSPDMRVPIQYALTYPDRFTLKQADRLRLEDIGKLHFKKMDFDRFRCLGFAYEAGRTGGTMPAVLNAANEAAVQLFLEEKILFLQIEEIIEKAMHEHTSQQQPDLKTIQEVDSETRSQILSFYK